MNLQLLDDISKTLFQIDPMGINFGTNTDEYDLEAYHLIPRLLGCKDKLDFYAALIMEFEYQFDHLDAWDKSYLAAAASEIWRLWVSYKESFYE